MKKIFVLTVVLIGTIICSCTTDDETNNGGELGSIYGIVTKLGTAEPMKAVGVELYKNSSLFLKTVTFDDGHFEFKDLTPENYRVKVVAKEYEPVEKSVAVEAGRQARIDLQIKLTVGRIYGVVTFTGTDTPVADAEIVLTPREKTYIVTAKVYSDKNGNYNINSVESGKYYISAQKDNYSTMVSANGYEIIVKSGESLEANLQLSKKDE